MTDIKILFEVTNNNTNIEVKAEEPEHFVAALVYLIETACDVLNIETASMVSTIGDMLTSREEKKKGDSDK